MIVLRWLVMLFVAFVSASGYYNFVNEIGEAETGLQRLVSALNLVHAILGTGLIAGMLRRREWAAWFALGWGGVIAAIATLAPLAYADEVTAGHALLGGAGAGLVALGVFWVARRQSRRPTSSISEDRRASGRSDQPS